MLTRQRFLSTTGPSLSVEALSGCSTRTNDPLINGQLSTIMHHNVPLSDATKIERVR